MVPFYIESRTVCCGRNYSQQTPRDCAKWFDIMEARNGIKLEVGFHEADLTIGSLYREVRFEDLRCNEVAIFIQDFDYLSPTCEGDVKWGQWKRYFENTSFYNRLRRAARNPWKSNPRKVIFKIHWWGPSTPATAFLNSPAFLISPQRVLNHLVFAPERPPMLEPSASVIFHASKCPSW